MKMKKRLFCLVMAGMLTVPTLAGCAAAGVESTAPVTEEKPADEATGEDAKPDNVFASDMFEITIPEDIVDVVEVATSHDRIDVYHKESKEAGFGGLELSVWAVGVPREYAGGPYVKIGQMNGGSGDEYDIVRGSATEIQWDYNLAEMPADFKKLDDAADSIIASVKGINGYTYEEGAGMKGEDLYGDVLAKYVQAVNEDWDADRLEAENMSPEFNYMNIHSNGGLDSIGYAYQDINCDGIDELFVGDMADGEFKGVVYDVYTMVDRSPAHVVSGSARDRYYDYENSFLCNEWSGGAGSYGMDVYVLENNSTEMVFQFGYKYDSYENEEKPWFLTYDQENYESISEDEYDSNTDTTDKYVRFDYTPLSKFEGAGTSSEEGDKTAEAELPPYEYPGPELFYSLLYKYLADEFGPDYPDGQVTIPCPIIVAEDDTDRDDMKLWGNFWIYKYDLNGDTLETAAGGSYPGCIHIKNTDEGYEITGMDIVEDGSGNTASAKKIFGKHYDEYVKSMADEEACEKIRAQIIANYVAANDLPIKAFKDYGWDPVPLPEENIDNFYSQLD